MSNQITLSPAHAQLAQMLDELALQSKECAQLSCTYTKVITSATCIHALKQALTHKAMEPIMDLQGSRLGFKTDRDTYHGEQRGYNVDTVRDVVVEACMHGLMPIGNQFNIIASNMYVTKEGLTYLLSNMQGLSRLKIKIQVGETIEKITKAKTKEGKPYDRVDRDANVQAAISCVYLGEQVDETLDLVIRVNAMMGHDAIIGKAERKAKAWLYNYLTGSGLGEGDADDVAPVAEMRDVTPTRETRSSSSSDRVRAARSTPVRGGLRGGAPAQAVDIKPEPVAQATPVPAPAAPVTQPAPAKAAAPALDLAQAAEPEEHYTLVTEDMKLFINELRIAYQNGNKNATTIKVRDWIAQLLNNQDLKMPIEGMAWQFAIEQILNNHAAQFDAQFGTSFSGVKGGVA